MPDKPIYQVGGLAEGEQDKPARVEIHETGCRQKCSAEDNSCKNLAPNILRPPDAMGQPQGHTEMCPHHTRRATQQARRTGLKILDTRNP